MILLSKIISQYFQERGEQEKLFPSFPTIISAHSCLNYAHKTIMILINKYYKNTYLQINLGISLNLFSSLLKIIQTSHNIFIKFTIKQDNSYSNKQKDNMIHKIKSSIANNNQSIFLEKLEINQIERKSIRCQQLMKPIKFLACFESWKN